MWLLPGNPPSLIQYIHIPISLSSTPGEHFGSINLFVALYCRIIRTHPLLTIPFNSFIYVSPLLQVAIRVIFLLPILNLPSSNSLAVIVFLAGKLVNIVSESTYKLLTVFRLVQCLFSFNAASLSATIRFSCCLGFSSSPSELICGCAFFQILMRRVNLSHTISLMNFDEYLGQVTSSSFSNSSTNSAAINSIAALFHWDDFPFEQSRWRSSSDGPGPSFE